MKRQLYYFQCHHTSLLLNFYTKFPKLFETFKIFLKTFIKAILIKVCFIIENLPNWTDQKLFAYYQNTASNVFTNFKMWISNFDSFFFATNLWTHWPYSLVFQNVIENEQAYIVCFDKKVFKIHNAYFKFHQANDCQIQTNKFGKKGPKLSLWHIKIMCHCFKLVLSAKIQQSSI